MRDDTDPTLVRNQPALSTSTGRSWLIVGGLFSAVALAVLVPMLWLAASGVALVGVIGVVVLYAAMIGVRLGLSGRRRLGMLAALMIAIAVLSLVCVALVAYLEWRVV